MPHRTSHSSGLPASLPLIYVVRFLSGCRYRAGSRSIPALSACLTMNVNLSPAIIPLILIYGCGPRPNSAPLPASANTSVAQPTQNVATAAPSPSPRKELTLKNGLRIITKNVKMENKDWRYRIDVEYPQLEGTNDRAIVALNRQIKTLSQNPTRGRWVDPRKRILRFSRNGRVSPTASTWTTTSCWQLTNFLVSTSLVITTALAPLTQFT